MSELLVVGMLLALFIILILVTKRWNKKRLEEVRRLGCICKEYNWLWVCTDRDCPIHGEWD